MLPPELSGVVPAATAAAWPIVASVLPDGGYLAGGTALAIHIRHRESRDLDVFVDRPFDTAAVRAGLEARGSLRVTLHTEDTLKALFDGTRVQFLEAAGHHVLEQPTVVAGLPVAGVRDILADKLKVLLDRSEIRDYFDLMCIELHTDYRCEQGLAFYRERYGRGPDDQTIFTIVRALGFLDDLAPDPALARHRAVLSEYWSRRQLEVLENLRSSS